MIKKRYQKVDIEKTMSKNTHRNLRAKIRSDSFAYVLFGSTCREMKYNVCDKRAYDEGVGHMPYLQWLSRDRDIRASGAAPYRLLEPVASYGDPRTENMLIQGDNLDALKAILPRFAGKVKCIYIDPPYNTRSAFEHYDDNLEHTTWLAMMYPRLELLRDLLSEDGSLWVSIDDNEAHYLKVIMDEIFGRKNFISTVIWRKNYSPKSSARHLSEDHDYIFIFAKNADLWVPNIMPRTEKQDKAYKNLDNDPRGPWKSSDLSARNYYSKGTYSIKCPGGRIIEGPPSGRYWVVSQETLTRLISENRIWWGKDGNSSPAVKRFLSDVKQGLVPQTYWPYEEVGHTQDAKKEIVALFGQEVFGTPKPERLIQRIIHIATNTGDLVLDSFLGSGTTAAVAHKMGRRYIGVEIGAHAETHCIPRLQKVIEGEQGGISEAVEWRGGGGFRFYRLGEAVFDENGQIRRDVRFPQLAAHIWFCETGLAWNTPRDTELSPLLGEHEGIAYYLLYNGILKDKSTNGGNTLTYAVLDALPPAKGAKVIYGMRTTIRQEKLALRSVTFKHIPFDVEKG